jgi:NAD(P)-dependent dehydrogenase (short-subunit alcohol dehydrogenase family)
MNPVSHSSSSHAAGPVLAGRAAIVTGGGQGVGRGIALALAEAGADVVVAGRTAARLEAVAAEIRELGRRGVALTTDVTRPGDPDRLVEEAVSTLGRLDVLVNNSGVMHMAPALETSDEDFDRVVRTNLGGTFACARAAARHYVGAGGGKVVNVASNLGLMGRAQFAAYCASKAAVINLTRALAVEWARYGVQVNAIAPGYVETDMNAELRADPERTQRVLRSVPARRMSRPEEIGPLVVYLASAASDFITGETLVIDGGETAR